MILVRFQFNLRLHVLASPIRRELRHFKFAAVPVG